MSVASPLKWHDVPDFPGYQVSEGGQCRRVLRSRKNIGRTRLLRPDVDARGRKRFSLCRGGGVFRILAARLVLLVFIGHCPEGMEACHNNGDETDNRLDNLRWDTHSANLMDRRGHGTAPCGEAINTAKLTTQDVVEIRRLRSAGSKLKPIAERFGVSEAMVSYICRGKNWQHVTEVA